MLQSLKTNFIVANSLDSDEMTSHSAVFNLGLHCLHKYLFRCFQYTHTVKPVLSGHSKRRPKIGFQDRFLLNAGQKYCRMHSAILLTFIKLPFVIKIFGLSNFEWPLKTCSTVQNVKRNIILYRHPKSGSFLRPKKTNLGVPLMAAVEDRYGRVEDENAGVITDDLYVVGGKNKQTVVEMVGARKVNDLQR